MKKVLLTVLLIVLSALLVFAGCGKKTDASEKKSEPAASKTGSQTEKDPEPEKEPENLSGGWRVTTDFGTPDLPARAKAAFDKAVTDGKYTPVAYLGSQVVAGVNYAFLCTDKDGALKTVTIYNDLKDNAIILNSKFVNIPDYTEDSTVEHTQLAGGFTFADAVGVPLDDAAIAAFGKAMENMDGEAREPLACLGTQVVAGTNYAILCKVSPVVPEPTFALAVTIVYEDLEGNASFRSVCGFTV